MTERAYQRRPTRWHIVPAGEPTYSELATEIRLDDEGGGEYVVLAQGRRNTGEVSITPQEWPALDDAIGHAMSHCLCSETQLARSPVTAVTRLQEIDLILKHVANRLDALAEQVSAASGGLVPEEHSTRASSLRRIAADYGEMACAVWRRQQGLEIDDD